MPIKTSPRVEKLDMVSKKKNKKISKENQNKKAFLSYYQHWRELQSRGISPGGSDIA